MLNIQTEKQYREIVEKYSDMIYRIAYQRVLNQYDAEDIVQEVFVKLLCNKNYFRDGEHVKAWLIRVTVNLCVNYKKKLAMLITRIQKMRSIIRSDRHFKRISGHHGTTNGFYIRVNL